MSELCEQTGQRKCGAKEANWVQVPESKGEQ